MIHETEKALHDILSISSHYVSHMVTVMASWQEAVQATASHMETNDTAIYFAHQEDMWRVTKEYMYITEVIRAREERDTAHT